MFIAFLVALSLNFDTFSVAIVEGAKAVKPTIKDSFKVGLFFGLGQAGMALTGFFLGFGFKLLVISLDHWVAFILLLIIGLKLIYESRYSENKNTKKSIINYKTLFILVVATSIDALIIGITLALIKESVVENILIIGLLTFIVSFTGFYAGKKLKKIFKSKTKIIGGLILISIGLKTLIQHLFFGG